MLHTFTCFSSSSLIIIPSSSSSSSSLTSSSYSFLPIINKIRITPSSVPMNCLGKLGSGFINKTSYISTMNSPSPSWVSQRLVNKCSHPTLKFQLIQTRMMKCLLSTNHEDFSRDLSINEDTESTNRPLTWMSVLPCGTTAWLSFAQEAESSEHIRVNAVYEVGELFELGIQLSYLLILLGLLGAGTFFVIRQVLVRRELDLSAKELQEQVRSGDANATELFELGAVMLRRKFYPAATKYLQQAISKWDGDDQDLAQVHNALGVSYTRDGKLEKGIIQFENAVKIQPGYVTAWNNLGDAYEKKNDLKAALKAFEEVLLFDPNNDLARPRRDALKERVQMLRGVPMKSTKKMQ